MSIKHMREKKGMGVYDLARKSNISPASIWRMENKGQVPKSSTAVTLAKALECTLEELLEPDPEEEQKRGA